MIVLKFKYLFFFHKRLKSKNKNKNKIITFFTSVPGSSKYIEPYNNLKRKHEHVNQSESEYCSLNKHFSFLKFIFCRVHYHVYI